jgi:hypothetical protein
MLKVPKFPTLGSRSAPIAAGICYVHCYALSQLFDYQVAERVGFEPTVSITPRPISNLTRHNH